MTSTTYLSAGGLVFIIAFVFSMLGLDGGMLYVPVFKWLELPFKAVAIPLSLLLNGVTTLSALVRYTREGLVDFRGGLPAALSALAIAPVGAYLMQYVPVTTLIILFAVTTALAGLRSLTARQGTADRDTISPRKRLFIGISVGSFEGFVGGLLGVGGGFIVAPILMELGYSPKRAAATTSFIMTFASASGFLAHAAEGRIEPLLTLITLVAAILGSQLGAWFMSKRAKPTLQPQIAASAFMKKRGVGVMPDEIPEPEQMELVNLVWNVPEADIMTIGESFEWDEDWLPETMGFVKCDACGELAAKAYLRLVGDKHVCIPCSGYDR